jgi:undecaprenyl-diphosphatase
LGSLSDAPAATGTTTARRLGAPLALVALSAGGAAALVGFASELLEHELDGLDALGHTWAESHRSPAADAFFSAATWTGSVAVLLPVCVLAAWLLHRRGRGGAAAVLFAPLLAVVVTNLLKYHFGRARPVGARLASFGTSFPSGHTTAATATALTLAYVLAREGIVPRALVAVAAVAVALLVGASRVYLDVHWASDVIGGWIVGAAIAAACAALYERARGLQPRAAPVEGAT